MKGQPNQYVVSSLRVATTDKGVTYAFMTGTVQGKGKKIDWKATTYDQAIREDIFDGSHTEALVVKEDTGWRVAHYNLDGTTETAVAASIGSTDVWWDGLWDRVGAPRVIFPGGESE